MILLVGVSDDPCMTLLMGSLEQSSVPFVFWEQSKFHDSVFEWSYTNSGVQGVLNTVGNRVDLAEIRAVYTRLEDLHRLFGRNEVTNRKKAELTLFEFLNWTQVTDARVVTRDHVGASNMSKPYQLQLIASHGFDVPETIVTSSPSAAMKFFRHHEGVVYKSISGVRSIVQAMKESDVERLSLLSSCPVQFQQLINGLDVRVHVVGSETFAVAIEKSEVDYRYNERPRYANYQLPEPVAKKCVELSKALGLEFAGVDLMVTPDGRVYCFEVNPMPGYSHFQMKTGIDISGGLVRLLAS